MCIGEFQVKVQLVVVSKVTRHFVRPFSQTMSLGDKTSFKVTAGYKKPRVSCKKKNRLQICHSP